MYLTALARLVDARMIFEIGTYNGVTAWTLAQNLPKATIHTLDLPPGVSPSLEILPTDRSNISNFQSRAYEGTAEKGRIFQELGDSAEFDFAPFFGRCDLVYVDGAHSLDYVRNDSDAAFKIASHRGVVVWDDYWRRMPDVAAYLHSTRRSNVFRLPESRLVVWFSDVAMRRITETEAYASSLETSPI
jgi:predicted O-methyltransferase YrrM